MPTSTRFAVAVHILTGLAVHENVPLTSEIISRSASTAPSVIRRIMSTLNDAGFSHSQLGKGGGALLSKPADQITLLDVFRAVETVSIFTLHRTAPDVGCEIGKYIQPILQEKMDIATAALELELSKVTIADIAAQIGESGKVCPDLMASINKTKG